LAFWSRWIQRWVVVGDTAWTVCWAAVMAILPSVVEPPTLTSHWARSAPLAKLVSMSAVMLLRSGRKLKVVVAGHGAGPCWIQTLCQCEANTRPPTEV